jgi:hypothetical protein
MLATHTHHPGVELMVHSIPQDLVSAVARYLTPEVVAKMASASGLDGSGARAAVKAAVPAILGSLVIIAETPSGVGKLVQGIADQPDGLLENLGKGPTRNARATSQASSLVASLLGGHGSSTLVSVLCKFVGVGPVSMRTVVNLLAPMILSVLRNQQRTASLDPDALACLLRRQKDRMFDAMPTGLSDALEQDGVFASVRPTAISGLHISDASDVKTPDQRRRRRSGLKIMSADWPFWALAVVLLGGLLWSMLPHAQQLAEAVKISAVPLHIVPDATLEAASQSSRLDWVSPNTYAGQDLYNRTGDKLGTIKAVLIRADGKSVAAIIGVGRYLGIGETDVTVPLLTLQLEPRNPNGHRIVMDATKDTLLAASALQKRQPIGR